MTGKLLFLCLLFYFMNNSYWLIFRKASDGILAKVAFQFRKSEHNPLSHVRFIVSHGHISSLKVDENYLKILKIPGR